MPAYVKRYAFWESMVWLNGLMTAGGIFAVCAIWGLFSDLPTVASSYGVGILMGAGLYVVGLLASKLGTEAAAVHEDRLRDLADRLTEEEALLRIARRKGMILRWTFFTWPIGLLVFVSDQCRFVARASAAKKDPIF